MEKGISLPTNALIIIVIAVFVLIAMLAMFTNIFRPSSSTISLETATRAVCQRVNPSLCNNGKYDWKQARSPVYDFDANRDGKVNNFTPVSNVVTTYCIDDNLEALCGFYYGCDIKTVNRRFSDVCNNGVYVADFITNDAEGQEWYNCCMKRICLC